MQKNIQKGTKGITLIALVITVIVILILAGVTISQLTGSDSTPAKANEASQKNAIGEAKDDIAITVQNAQMDAYNSVYVDGTGVGTSTPVTKGNASTTVGEYVIRTVKAKYDANSKVGSVTVEVATDGTIRVYTTDFEETGTINASGGALTWNGIGTITGSTITDSQRIRTHKTAQGTTVVAVSENANETLYDDNDKPVIIPAGFGIAKDSGTKIEEGIVIEDVFSTDVKRGSQFVWVPVNQTVTYNSNYVNSDQQKLLADNSSFETKGATSGTIKLSRYDFGSLYETSNSTLIPRNAQYEIKQVYSWGTFYFAENKTGFTGTQGTYHISVARDIDDFICKTNSAKGFYIGRYEAGKENNKTVCKNASTVSIYNNVTRDVAKNAAQGLYGVESNKYASDLINSYAWDTAIVFMEKCGGNSNYAFQTGVQSGGPFAPGTETTDEICKIQGMATNVVEWTTESSSDTNNPCVNRGGFYGAGSLYASSRNYYSTAYSDGNFGFRSILYILQD